MKKYASTIYFILSVLFIVFSFWIVFYEYGRRDDLQPIRSFELVHNFYTDFNFYRSRIRQGLEGALTVKEKYTSEPHNGSYLHVMYLAMGWVGKWVRVPWGLTSDIYHVARFVLGVTLLLTIASFAKKYLKGHWWQMTGFLLAVTASSWPKIVEVGESWRFGGYMAWWSVMDSLQRISFIPHLLAGQALMLFVLMQLTDRSIMRRGGNWVFLGVLGFVLGIIFPPGLLFVYGVIGVHAVMTFWYRFGNIKKRNRLKGLVKLFIPDIVFGILTAPSLLYLQLMTRFYPWKRLAEFDITDPLPFKYFEYIQALGPILPLGLIGLVIAMKRKQKTMLLSSSWIIAWLIFLVVFDFIPQQSPLRFSEMIPHVPFAILTVHMFRCLYDFLKKKKTILLPIRQTAAILMFLIPVGLVTLGIGMMHSSWLWQRDFIDHKIRASLPLVPTESYVMYPLKDFLSAITFLQDATTRDTVIFSETTAGNYIPVYSGNTVYVGHANTVHKKAKEDIVTRFYCGQIGAEDAYTLLKNEKIGAVFFGPQEKEDCHVNNMQQLYPFLEVAYENPMVTIYWINQNWK